jgi:hypothetical protein
MGLSVSYGLTTELLQEVLPMDSPLHASTIREPVCSVAQRLEDEMGEEQSSFMEGCQRDWNQLPPPDGPLTVGIDGGYIRGRNKEGHFEVVAGKSLLASGVKAKKRKSYPVSVSLLCRPTMRSPSAGYSRCCARKG